MKKSKIIIPMYLTAISLCIATFSMSIAWYTTSTHLQVSNVEITIDCDKQLAISTEKDGKYVTSLDNDDLKEPGLFTPVTSAYQSTWFDYGSDMPFFFDDTNYTEFEDGITTSKVSDGFFSQKLYLKSDDNVWVSINPEDTYIHAHSDINGTYARELYEKYQSGSDEELKKLTKEEIEERLNSLVNAMRYSILVNDENYYSYTIIDPNKEVDTYYGGLLDNNVDRYYDYFNRGSQGFERLYGEYNDKSYLVYDEASVGDSDYDIIDADPSAFNARHKEGINRLNLEESFNRGLEIKKEESYSLEEFATTTKPLYIPVYRDRPTEIVLSIYIEGWDLDSINYTMGATFIADLVLKIEGVM